MSEEVYVVWCDDYILGVYTSEEMAIAIRSKYPAARIGVDMQFIDDPFWIDLVKDKK